MSIFCRIRCGSLFVLFFIAFLTFWKSNFWAQGVVVDVTPNMACNGIPCGIPGPKILINEIMVSPGINDGSISGPGPSGGRGEWVELYNPDACNAVDISCYILGNNTFEGTGAFRIPPNTIIPPLGFAIIRGVDAPVIPAASLVSNGGNVVNITAPPEVNLPGLCVVGNPGNRFWFPNSGGWVAIYDPSGVVQDAIRWGTANISSLAVGPCVPGFSGCTNPSSLASYNNIPLNRKSWASTANGNNHLGETIRRLPDGGVWSSFAPPTFAQCNGPCYTTAQSVCTGTATVISAPGTAPHTYQWNDPFNQTLQHAIGLCPGNYTVTVTSSDNVVSTQTITIGQFQPAVSFNAQTFCTNSGIQAISGYSPIPTSGQTGTFSGPGVNNSNFNPNSAGVGSHNITYTFTNQNGCSNSMQAIFTVNPVPSITLSSIAPLCVTAAPVPIVYSPASATLSGPGVVGNMFNPGLAGPGTHQITLTFTDPNNCTNPATTVLTTNVTVNAQAIPQFPAPPNYCVGDAVPNLPTTSNQGITGTWSPAINNQQTTTYTFTPNPNQCALPTTYTIPINPGVTPAFNPVGPFCAGASIAALPNVSTNGITGLWTPAINNQTTTTYTFTPVAGQCAATVTQTITINPILTPSFNAMGPFCAGAAISPLPTVSNNGVSGAWSPPLNNQTTTAYLFTPNPGQCAVSSSIAVTIVGGPISLTCPANQTASCFANISPAYSTWNEFQSAGGSLSSTESFLVFNTFTLQSQNANGQSCNAQMLRVYNFSNICGQTASCTQTIAINDNIPPQGTAPANFTVDCIQNIPAANAGSVTNLSDNCSTPTVSHLSDVTVGSCPSVVHRTYRIQDACGNFNDVVQLITVLDTIPPTGTAPPDLTFGCILQVPAPNVNAVSNVSDNCSTPVVTHLSDVFSGSCPQIISRTYRVQDACGNFTDLVQLITVFDSIFPVGNPPANITVNCIEQVPAPNINLVTNVSDNCGQPTVSFLSDTGSGSCPQIITRTYRIQDDCGNFTDVNQLITVLDSIPPTATAPANIVVNCPANIPPTNPGLVTNAIDNCGIPTVSFFADVSDNNLCNNEVITRTYVVEDACGNQSFVSHTITIALIIPTATLSFTNPTTCQGSEGVITISGLIPNTAYVISYNNQTFSSTCNAQGQLQITNLTQGTYSNFQVAYAACNSCAQTINQTIILSDPPNPQVSAGPDVAFCEGNQYFIEAYNPENALISWSDNIVDGSLITPPIGGNVYTVTALLNNCTGTDQITVTVHPLPMVNAGTDLTVCANTPIVVNATGAQTYFWSSGVQNGVPFYQSDVTQTYTVVGVDQYGCFDEDELTITLTENPFPSFTPTQMSSCERPFVVNFGGSSPLPAVNCVWDFGIAGQQSGNCDFAQATFEYVGFYGVTFTVQYQNGCSNFIHLDSVVQVYPVPTAQFFSSPTQPVVETDVLFFNTSQQAENYMWYLVPNEPPILAQDLTYNFANSGVYDITLVAINEYGCTDTTKQTMEVTNPIILYVPNTFTPDGDQYNNEFKPILAGGYDPYNYELTIFNRWGEVLFVSQNASVGWSGTYGGHLVQQGTYIWQIEVKNEKGIRERHRGFFNLLK